MAPRVLANRYRVLDLIGAGGMARVYRGFDANLGRPVAVKTMKPELAAQPGFVKQFEQEARSAARLNDPCIVSVYDWGIDRLDCFIIMELVDGFDVRSLLRNQGDLYPRAAVRIAKQVCQALDVAHGYGIVHSDVKPSNIMFTRSGGVKMADFGIVQIGRSRVQAQGAVGTARYMSPEQAQGKPLDRRSDVYSLGVTLYEMCGGLRLAAEHAKRAADTSFSTASEGARPSWTYVPLSRLNPEIDEDLDRIVEKSLAEDPNDRYPTAGKFGDALQEYLDMHEAIDDEVLGARHPQYWALEFVAENAKSTNRVRLDGPTVVGRSADADLQIPSRSVSGKHVLIEPKGGFLMVEDLGSSNGTYLNGFPIHRRVYCLPGDMLKVGETRFRIGCKH